MNLLKLKKKELLQWIKDLEDENVIRELLILKTQF